MANLSEKVKITIVKRLLREPNPFGELDEGGGNLNFLKRVWDLDEMPSEEHRFKTASEDIIQHTINNDYDNEYLLLVRLRLALSSDDIFFRFIEAVVSPETREVKDEIIRYVSILNPYLDKFGFSLIIKDYDENLPVYSVRQKDKIGNLPSDLKENDIPFFVFKNHETYQAFRPKVYPCFTLVKDNWNDYQIQTLFNFFFFPKSNAEPIHLGSIKIMKREETDTVNSIPGKFMNLDEEYCSIGQGIEFYETLKLKLGHNFFSVLYALKDCAFFPEILERFERDQIFQTSLIRYDAQERLSRMAKHMLKNPDLTDLYKFDYIFQPKHGKEPLSISFLFESQTDLPHRIYALIGKNGTGKTQLISSLPLDLSQKNEKLFSPSLPLFSKIIAVSYSIFDKFQIPKKTAEFNYVYCGLKESPDKILSEDVLLERFFKSIDKIKELERTISLKKILGNFLEVELINVFFEQDSKLPFPDVVKDPIIFKKDIFYEHKERLSSGQNIILYIVTEIMANIRFDSLLLYDEPETHLHPNAVSQLINTIYELIDEFESYCIIATHSPLIIQEIPSRDVYIIERTNEIISAKKIATESFGENLTTLTEEVFGIRETSKQYKKIIQRMVDSGKTFEEILSILETDNIPLSLNATLYIKSLILNRHEKLEAL